MSEITAVLVLVVFLGVILLLLKKRKSYLSLEQVDSATAKLKGISLSNPEMGLMQAHKVFIATLKTLDPKYSKLTAAQVTEKLSPRLPNIKRIWYFHRLRNQAAHEVDVQIKKSQTQEAIQLYVRSLEVLVK